MNNRGKLYESFLVEVNLLSREVGVSRGCVSTQHLSRVADITIIGPISEITCEPNKATCALH